MRSRGPSTAPTPGELDARRADDQVRTRGVRLAECDNSRAALAEAHIVGEDGATSTEEEGDARPLMRVQARVRVANLTCRVRERFSRWERSVCIRSRHVSPMPSPRVALRLSQKFSRARARAREDARQRSCSRCERFTRWLSNLT